MLSGTISQRKYKKENVTYFLYLARVYKNLNNASMKIAKKEIQGSTGRIHGIPAGQIL
jgi:hypothetical protein